MSTGTNDPKRCEWCGNFHAFICPLVKSIEYAENGLIKRVEFFSGPAAIARIPDGPVGAS